MTPGATQTVDTTVECPGCGYMLWIRSPELPMISGTLPQVAPEGECFFCGYDGGFV